MFEPFEPCASGAAPSGLGLRLARDGLRVMGGQLTLVPSTDGADTDLLPQILEYPTAAGAAGPSTDIAPEWRATGKSMATLVPSPSVD